MSLTDLMTIIPLGLLVGVTMGALGGGGAVLAVPALIYLLHQPPAAATTGSLLVVGVTAIVSAVQHHRAGNVRWREGTIFGAVGLIGAAAGTWLAHLTSPEVLLALFSALLLVVAGVMVHRLRSAGDAEPVRRGPAAVVSAAVGVGLLTGFFGVGGGFAAVPALTLLLGFAMPAAVGTSLLVIAINCVTALASKLAFAGHDLDWPVLAVFAAGAVTGGLAGGWIGRRIGARRLQYVFAAMLVVIAVVMGVQNVPAALRG